MHRLLPLLVATLLSTTLALRCTNAQVAANGSADKAASETGKTTNPYYSRTDTTRLQVSNAEWKKILPEEVYAVGREAETERAFTGKYYQTDVRGDYYCAVCGNHLFRSTAKFASGCGWPSFFEPIRTAAVRYLPDNTHDMERTEVQCGRCDSHLGHLFDDGPPPTGKRFCMNSAVLEFEE